MAIDDATRHAYVKVPEDEQQGTAIGLLILAVAWRNSQDVVSRQVMSDNGSAYISRSFDKAFSIRGLQHIRTRPYTPGTNGKAERFIQTLCREWGNSMLLNNAEKRNPWLPRYLSVCNRRRSHSHLSGRSPQHQLYELIC